MNKAFFQNKNNLIYLFAAAVSLLLSFWVALREVVINPDAICYLQSAEVIGNGGLRKAMNLCAQANWPFYSVLIFGLGHLTHLSFTVSAYLINAIFSAMSVVTFIVIVRELGGTRRVLWLAAAVILMAHQFNSIRQYIIRDHGFLAFYLLSVFLLLRYLTTPRFTYALYWGLSLLAATLFRIEGAVFMLMLPWVLWFNPEMNNWQRTKAFLQLNLVTLVAGFGVLGWLIFHPEISLASLGRLQDLVFQFFHGGSLVWSRFETSANAFSSTILTPESMQDATLVFTVSVIAWYLVRVAQNLSLIYAGLMFYGLMRKTLSLIPARRLVLFGYLAINVLITSLFLAQHLFLSKRYLIALTLILMLWVPFALDRILRRWQLHQAPRWVMPSVVFLMLMAAAGGIFDFGYSKTYLRDAGGWLAENLPASANLYANDYQVMYYSHHFGNDIFDKIKLYSSATALTKGRWRNYDYVALRLSKHDLQTKPANAALLKRQPIKVFANKRGDQVRVYKIEETA